MHINVELTYAAGVYKLNECGWQVREADIICIRMGFWSAFFPFAICDHAVIIAWRYLQTPYFSPVRGSRGFGESVFNAFNCNAAVDRLHVDRNGVWKKKKKQLYISITIRPFMIHCQCHSHGQFHNRTWSLNRRIVVTCSGFPGQYRVLEKTPSRWLGGSFGQ